MVTCSSQVQSKYIQNVRTKYEYKGHLTKHLVCPSAPLGEVVHVRLDLVLGDLLLALVLKSLLEEGFLDGVSLSRGQTGLKSCSCHNSIMAADLMLINITLCCCCCFVFKFNLFCGKGDNNVFP